MTESENYSWPYLPFIFLAKIYIRFYKEKKDFWIIFPSHIIALIISLNIYVLVKINYDTNIYLIIALYFLLYFILSYVFGRRFANITELEKINLNLKQKIISTLFFTIGIANFIILLNFIRNH